MHSFLFYFIVFIIYSFLGWLLEVIYGLITRKKFINCGFLIGPICPIYGFSAIFIIIYLVKYKNDPAAVFILGAFICTLIEYITSYLMEKLFKVRWWDYSNYKFNINGRVCLYFSFIFGIGAILTVCFINPIIINLVNLIPNIWMLIISIILLILFLSDVITSFNIINKVKLTAQNVSKDYTEEINKKVNSIFQNKIFQARLLHAFPKLKFISRQKNKK